MASQWERTWKAREEARQERIEAMLGEILIRVAKERREWLPFIVAAALDGWKTPRRGA